MREEENESREADLTSPEKQIQRTVSGGEKKEKELEKDYVNVCLNVS